MRAHRLPVELWRVIYGMDPTFRNHMSTAVIPCVRFRGRPRSPEMPAPPSCADRLLAPFYACLLVSLIIRAT